MAMTTACVHGGDGPLRALLADVLGECGVTVSPGAQPHTAQLLVVPVTTDLGLRRLLLLAATRPARPVLAVLPFEDEALAAQALSLGASGCYALGTPLERLRSVVRTLTRKVP
jgi:hypothetical protein